MSLEQFYAACNGNLDDALGRLMKEDRVAKFVRLFMQDPTHDQLASAFDEGNAEDAFRAAHTMKGLAANLSFTQLYDASVALTEVLRPASKGETVDLSSIQAQKQALDDAYELIVAAMPLLPAE